MITRVVFEFSVPAYRGRSMLPPAFGASRRPNDELVGARIIAAPGLRPVVAFEKWVTSDQRLLAQVGVIEAQDPSDLLRPPHLVEFKPRPDPGPITGRWVFAGVGDVPPELLFRLAHWLSGSRPSTGLRSSTGIRQMLKAGSLLRHRALKPNTITRPASRPAGVARRFARVTAGWGRWRREATW